MKLLTDYFIVKNNLQNPDKPIVSNGQPTKQQLAVINAPANKNLSIIACAGSGKTTTLINRISELVKSGVNAGSIILTTFTRDSAKDMTQKLNKKLGNVNMFVGTIDSLSLFFLRKFGLLDEELLNVGEYAVHFLEFLQNHDERKVFFSQFKYLIVDEFQDINELQYEIISQFHKNGINIIGVGDDGQNIYTFRGSQIKYIVDFQKYFGGEVFYLTNNFRSTNQIIDVANYTIEKAQYILPKKMVAQRGFNGEKPKVNFFYNQEEQANYIIAQIQSYHKLVKKYDEICVLAPMNATLYKLEENALARNIPVNLLDNKDDGMSAGIKRGKVTLCTIHKSKGLEWDVVFVIGMNDELFPPEKDADKVEESRRLFYVATTRARKFLHYCFTPMNGAKTVSRFIAEIPQTLVNWTGFQKEFLGESVDSHIKDKNGVVEKIQSLQIPEINYLRKKGIIPNPEVEVLEIHPPIRLSKWVEDNNLHKDFGIYLDTIICRELAIKSGKRISNYACLGCVAMVNVDVKLYKAYNENICIIHKYFETGDLGLVETMDNDARKVMEMILKNAKKFGIFPREIAVHPQNFLPKKWKAEVANSYQNFVDKRKNSCDIAKDIWNVSLCNQIFNEGRRKMLYINVQMDKITDFCEQVVANSVHMEKYVRGKPVIHEKVGIDGLRGEIDFWVGGQLWEIKMSYEKKLTMDWILQLMCYDGLMEYEVQTYVVYNGLQGRLIIMPKVNDKKCKKLVEYLSTKST